MPRLGPTGGGGNRQPAEVVSPGQYVIVLRWFKRGQVESTRKDYFSGLFEILDRPLRGKNFWALRSLDFAKDSTVKFWQSWIDAVQCREEIELGATDEGTANEGDANIRRVFRGKPIVAEVVQDPDDRGQPRNGIKFLVFRSKWTDEQRQIAQEFLDKRGGSRDPAEDVAPPEDDGYEPRDEDAPPARGRAREDDWDPPARQRATDSHGPGDAYPRGRGYGDDSDDIPF